MTETIVDVHELTCALNTPTGQIAVVRNTSLSLQQGETLGLVGESGCGKSMLSLSLVGLLPAPHARIVSGQIHFEGHDLAVASEAHLRRVRGNRIAMIFQDPMTSLNPFLTIERQLTEVLQAHQPSSRVAMRQRVIQALQEVGIEPAAQRIKAYPHAFSGGMRQRVMIAMALLCTPAVLLADEPTTALDVTVQAQILDVLGRLQSVHKTALLLISHDIDVVASRAQRIAVMYAGRIVEMGPAEGVYRQPLHPYTQALLACVPRLHGAAATRRLTPIPGNPAHPAHLPSGCAYRRRCSRAQTICSAQDPQLQSDGARHAVACHNPLPNGAVKAI